MNNPIFIFSLDSINECWFDYCFLKNYTFHKLTSEFCFFLFFFWESSAGEFWSSNPNKLLHVRQFAASNQCNRSRPDLLENTTVKLRSVYVRWLVDFDPRTLSVSIGVRAGGARGAAAPPNFGQLRFFGQREKIWAKPVFKDVFMFI